MERTALGSLVVMMTVLAALLLPAALPALVRYSRVSRGNPSDHPARRQILDVLHREPSKTVTELGKVLGYTWGTIRHHMYLLQRAGLVSVVRAGRERRFFMPEKGRMMRDGKTLLLLRNRAQEIVEAISRRPGLIQKEILRETGASRKVFREQMDALVKKGIITELTDAKTRRYYLRSASTDATDPMDAPGGQVGPRLGES